MKKQLLAGAASLVMAATPVLGVFAESPQAGTADGTFIGTHDVKVGEVDETVYSVDINWGDLTFDWKYDENINDFNFKAHYSCQAAIYNDNTSEDLNKAQELGRLYSNTTCTESEDSELIDESTYYILETLPEGQINVSDYSVNGKIKITASFTQESDYGWVIGKFGQWATTSGSNGMFDDYTVFNEFTDGIFTADPVNSKLFVGYLKLEKNPNMGSTTPIAPNDKIGTVTLSIEPDVE